jgi:hypothetical protein
MMLEEKTIVVEVPAPPIDNAVWALPAKPKKPVPWWDRDFGLLLIIVGCVIGIAAISYG